MGKMAFFLHGEVTTWEIVIWENIHLGSCHLGKYPCELAAWEKTFRKVPNTCYIIYQICLATICLATPSFNDIMSSGVLIYLSLSIYILYQICLASPSFNDIMSSGILVHLYIYPIPDMSGYSILQ